MNDPDLPKPKHRWYRVTPHSLLLLMLATEVLLFLSERFRWFPFNDHKGWTVLIAAAMVGLAVLIGLLWLGVSLLLRRRFQFSIRSLLLLVVVVAVMCSWFAVKMQQARRQAKVLAAIEKVGGGALYDYQLDANGVVRNPKPPGPAWLRDLLGVDFLSDVVWCIGGINAGLEQLQGLRVFVGRGGEVTDAGLERLKGLKNLECVNLTGADVTDTGLQHLGGLTNLEVLTLAETKVSDAGLEHLKPLRSLQILVLSDTRVTGTGVEHLKALSRLRLLELAGSEVVDGELKHLKQLRGLNELNLAGTGVTDEGLAHLKELTSLESLNLWSSEVSDAGLEHLGGLTSLKRLDLGMTEVTDAGLEHLSGLTNLKSLILLFTKVTNEGVKNLQQALPNCKIEHPAVKSQSQPFRLDFDSLGVFGGAGGSGRE